MKEELLKNFSEKTQELLGSNLKAIMVYGSVLNGEKHSDLDIMVILKEKTNPLEDFKCLESIKDEFKDEQFDLQLFYLEEILNPKLFSLDAHGAFFLEVLKSSKVVFGENVFENLEVETEDRQRSALNKIQNYIFRARQEAMGLGRHSKDKNPFYHRKKILRVIYDILLFDNANSTEEDLIAKFKENYPEVLSQEDMINLMEDKLCDLGKYMEIYEKLYSLIIKKANIHIPSKSVKPKRANISGILFEYIIGSKPSKAVIVLEGLPNLPDQKRIMNIFANQGYSVFYPRYRGTWESAGSFLEESPTDDIEFLMDSLIDGILLDGEVRKYDEISVVASSFGGSVALSLKDRKEIKRILALSPVYDYTKIPSLATLPNFLRDCFLKGYRFDEASWKNLLRGKIINPIVGVRNFKHKDKIIIFGGEKDPEINIEELGKFAQEYEIKFYRFGNRGHISYSKLSENVLEEALKVL